MGIFIGIGNYIGRKNTFLTNKDPSNIYYNLITEEGGNILTEMYNLILRDLNNIASEDSLIIISEDGRVIIRDEFVQPIASYRAYDKTNDDADRAVLKDLTGNGHDIQLYNFAFAESSGYGLYLFNFSIDPSSKNYITKIGYQKYCINGNHTGWLLYKYYNGNINFRIKISNLKDNQIRILIGEKQSVIISEDGIYSFNKNDEIQSYILILSGINHNYNNVIIELLPDYKGALVSDGVDDYGLCENFPILTKEKGYTVCAIRAIINTVNLGTIAGNGTNYTNGSFLFEYYLERGDRIRTISFGGVSELNPQPSRNISFIYQTKDKYNGKAINVGNVSQSGDILALFSAFKRARSSSIVLYALEIYDRDLTDEEIATVKARMIAEYEEKTGNKYEEETV